MVLDHMGLALAMDMGTTRRDEVFQVWRKELRGLARLDNVLCKIGGVGTAARTYRIGIPEF